MYGLMSNQISDILLLSMLLLVIAFAGWLLARHAFRLPARERLLVGAALGVVVYIFLANLLAKFLSPTWSFWLAGLILLALGGAAWYQDRGRSQAVDDFHIWPLLLFLILSATLITVIGRGVAIFDDRKNLSIISIMAAGDIPPHFYMNPQYFFNYHYGFQLFGAVLMRVGGLFPWSAFDFAKGITAALALSLAALWGWRVSHSKLWGVVTVVIVSFASGGRWMLNFLPQSILRRVSAGVDLWGASESTVGSLYEGLTRIWSIDGGPPLALPFSYVNGILQPFILKLHKGPISLHLTILFLALLLLGKRRNWFGSVMMMLIFATWALVAEAEFVLFGLGYLLVWLFLMVRDGARATFRREDLRHPGIALLAGSAISLFQGGTITEIAKGFIGLRAGSGLGGGTGVGGFQIRWPPAIVSAHLGELQLTDSNEILVGLLEIGPAIFAGLLVALFISRWLGRDRLPESILAVGSFVGILLPLFIQYDVDRDITRLSAYALMGWILLAVPILALMFRRLKTDWIRILSGVWIASLIFGGLVVTGSLITAIPRASFSYHISDLDVHMTSKVWDKLPHDALVLDSHEWRSIPVTGRLTKSSADNTNRLDGWLRIVDSPDVYAIANAGYDFVYVDEAWWGGMTPERQAGFEEGCVSLFAGVEDTSKVHFRRLYDVRRCGAGVSD